MQDSYFSTTHPTEHYDLYVTLDGEHSRLAHVVDTEGQDVELTPDEEAIVLQQALQHADDGD